MARLKVVCTACSGRGNLPADEKKNAYGEIRTFPYRCDRCQWEGKVWADIVVEEQPKSASNSEECCYYGFGY